MWNFDTAALNVDVVCTWGYIGPGAGMTFLGSFLVLLVAFFLLLISILTWPFRFAILSTRRLLRGIKGETDRVIVLGLDGLDPQRVRRMIAQDRLPHLKKLADEGTFTDLGTTLPPISPVAWSSFQTGVNPGKHCIFDFLNRDLRTYLPELSSVRITEKTGGGFWSRFGLGGSSIRLLRKSQPFWKILGENGIFSTILRVPISFPPEKFYGLSLSAMCTPDIRGTQGTFTFYTTDPDETEQATGGLCIPVRRDGNRIETRLPGPPNHPGNTPEDFEVKLTINILPGKNKITLQVGDEKRSLSLNEDSGWVRLTYRCGWFTKVRAICRFRLESLEPHFRLYVSPIHLDPERPAMPISHPTYYSIYLAKLHDAFATLGLAEDTWALNAGKIGEGAFLEQAYVIHDERSRMFLDAIRRMPRGLSVCVFDASDRIQHMFSRHDNVDHPANVGKDNVTYANAIDEMYERIDKLVGDVVNEIGENEVLMVISDHGFTDFRRGVNLNVWLKQNGYLVLQEGVKEGEYLSAVDWSKTRAYSFGLSGIYINQEGREAKGIVAKDKADVLRKELAQKLTGLIDEESKTQAIRQVYDSHMAYQGPYKGDGPDLIVGYDKGYRASWDNAVGRTDGPVFHDNTRYWSGDHCVDPSLVPGVFFSNYKWDDDNPGIIDLAPTILKLFGVNPPGYMDGKAMTRVTDTIQSETKPEAPAKELVPMK
ncbi:MAG: alkaline phosphatase family protein [Planctomycetota bacterium]|nr:alkaline phosphatase family protein [Planctomycetota bacterium]